MIALAYGNDQLFVMDWCRVGFHQQRVENQQQQQQQQQQLHQEKVVTTYLFPLLFGGKFSSLSTIKGSIGYLHFRCL